MIKVKRQGYALVYILCCVLSWIWIATMTAFSESTHTRQNFRCTEDLVTRHRSTSHEQ